MSNVIYEQVDKFDETTNKFDEQAWAEVDKEHYGSQIINWDGHLILLVAKKGSDVVGLLKCSYFAGVGHIHKVIVGTSTRGQGVGKQLMQMCESEAKKAKLHKLWLTTRNDWDAYQLYKKLGYKDVAELQNHYGGLSFILMDKQI